MKAEESLRVLSPLDRRIPTWDLRALKPRVCPFCGDRGVPRFQRPDRLIVRACTRCDAFFVSPAPGPRQLAHFYRTYFSAHRRKELTLHRSDPLLVREMHAAEPSRDAKARVLAGLVNLRAARVLDVGFGMGQMLLLLRKAGAEIHGIDLDPDAVEFVRDILHLDAVRRADIADLPITTKFNLITLHDLVEHPLHPIDLLRRARSLLTPGGILSVWTPNASYAASDEVPILFRVDLEHMQYLSARTCNVLADRLDLDIIHLEHSGHPDLAKITWLSGQSSPSRRARDVFRRVFGSLPGAAALNAFRRRLTPQPTDRGSYHLFCVFRRP